MIIKTISLKEVEYTAFRLAKELMTWDEPIPDFGTRYPNILESCIGAPFQTFYSKPLYKKLTGKAAILFYLMVKNHPFEDGNKRIAVMTLFVFLFRNRKWLRVTNEGLYKFAVGIAKSKPRLKDKYIAHIEAFLNKNLVDYYPHKPRM